MIHNIIDGLVAAISPVAGLRRAQARAATAALRSYEAGRLDRTTMPKHPREESGESSNLGEVARVRANAWEQYRNNPIVRKACRACVAQIVGCGLRPQSLAVKNNKEPDSAFREAAAELWSLVNKEIVLYGGMTFNQAQAAIMREVLLTGEAFIRIHRFREGQADERILPVALEIVSAERVPEISFENASVIPQGHFVYRGIEFTDIGTVSAYHMLKHHPQDPRQFSMKVETVRIPASEIMHIYFADRPDTVRGVSMFAPVLLQVRDVGDYQETELYAAHAGACVVAAITRQPGSGSLGGLAAPVGSRTTDTDGNSIKRLQPGMFLDNLRPGEKIEGFNPQRPNTAAEAFIQHMLRNVAIGLPGLKASTLIADYRGSSFSSEKSADNDCWRETEQMQEWLASKLCQPVWELVLETGILLGWFDKPLDRRVFRRANYPVERQRYLACEWSGPVAGQINPTDEETASEKAMAIGTSNLQIECARRGYNWEDVLAGQAEVTARRKELDIPDPQQMAAEAMKAKVAGSQSKNDTDNGNPAPGSNGSKGRIAFGLGGGHG